MTLNKSFLILGFLLFTPAVFSAESMGEVESIAKSDSEDTYSDKVQELVIQALSLIGINYRYGGRSPETGLDCSGFVRYVFSQAAGIMLPHNAYAISQLGKTIQPSELKPGDLVFFNTLRRAFSHVGIYLGDNRFVHAPSSGGKVQVVNMTDRYWASRFDGARRLFTPEKTTDQSVKTTLPFQASVSDE